MKTYDDFTPEERERMGIELLAAIEELRKQEIEHFAEEWGVHPDTARRMLEL